MAKARAKSIQLRRRVIVKRGADIPAVTAMLGAVGKIPGFPFATFPELQEAISRRRFSLGVDPLAAAEWSDRFNTRFKRSLIAAFSMLLIGAAVASVAAAVSLGDYWLLGAVPVMAITFYLANPGLSIHKWVTIGGALSIAIFLNLLLNGLVTAATLVAYAGLTFAAVRAVGFINNQSFRKALTSDEEMFIAAYSNAACTLRDNETKAVYSSGIGAAGSGLQ